jgi:hypothetical protein
MEMFDGLNGEMDAIGALCALVGASLEGKMYRLKPSDGWLWGEQMNNRLTRIELEVKDGGTSTRINPASKIHDLNDLGFAGVDRSVRN